MKVATVEEIKRLDEIAVTNFNLSEELLMENAGIAVYDVIKTHGAVEGKLFLIFCGTGNNGGDGFVVARKLSSSGANVSVFVLGDRSKIAGVSKLNLERLSAYPVEIFEINAINRIVEISLLKCDAIVDAIFGTGLLKEIEGFRKEIINEINMINKPVYSVDIPSGVNGDTGELMGCAVKAKYTITMGLPKRGQFIYPGADFTGTLYVSHISYPPALIESEEIKVELNKPEALPERKTDAHKGDFGKALFISGSKQYLGAPYFASLSFLKAGGGVAYLATPESVAPHITTNAREVVLVPVKEQDGVISKENIEDLLEFSKNVDIVSIGSGLSLSEETKELSYQFIDRCEKPIIIDGDGLTMIAKHCEILRTRKNITILTPHPGEFSRLVKKDIEEIKHKCFKILSNASREMNSIIVLKGAHTLISYPYGKIWINLSGNPGMATAGSGDVLTGIIAAMYCTEQKEKGVNTGVFIHGLSGDLVAKEIGMDGVTATAILNSTSIAIKYFRDHYNEIEENYYGRVYTV